MSTETRDPYIALSRELAWLGRRIDAIGTELLQLRAAAAPVGSGAAPAVEAPQSSRSGDVRSVEQVASNVDSVTPTSRISPHSSVAPPPREAGQTASPAPFPQPVAPARPRSPISGARLLAWVGSGVTLLGIVLLLVLAASRGWFSPAARVSAGAVLGMALVVIALRLHRRDSARTGALALAATGFATLYLVVAAATALYGYLPEVSALLVELVVAAAGLGLADRWRSQLLAGGVVVGAALLAPLLVTDWL
ncbi:MAG TPA: DUF2339 domain-containing protein, partial [Pseudonocardia sp.]